MSRFSPVRLPADRALNDRASMTLLRHFNLCARSAYLYQQFKGEASTPAMQKGKAGHRIIERSIRTAIEHGEPMIPGDITKVIVAEVLAQEHVPMEEHDRLREAIWRWSAETAVDPSSVVALETLFAIDIDGFQVRCRIDFAESIEDGAAVAVKDWKFALGAPPYEEIARTRPDGTRMAKSMQLLVYALALAYGVPVREETCDWCGGRGYVGEQGTSVNPRNGVASVDPQLDTTEDCDRCSHGRIEIPEPFPVASRAQRFDCEFVFPAIEDREGKMVRRPVTLTRLELEETMDSLRGLVARVREAEATGDWPAMVSDEGCSICPAPSECPIPVELRDHRGTINTPEEFAEAMARAEVETKDLRARKSELRAFLKAHGGRLEFDGKVALLEFSEHETVVDREAMFQAMERSMKYGEPFDRSEHVKTKGSTSFKTRDLTVDDREEVAGD